MLKCHIQETPAIIVTVSFPKDVELVYRNDVEGLLHVLGCAHNTEELRLFCRFILIYFKDGAFT